jgi:quercetin dioxygenase-like cupin family protein
MAKLESKPLNQPDETRPIEKGTVEIVQLDGASVMRTTFEPGWRWSECVKPVAGTDSCQTHHVGYTVSGRMHVVMDDGSELDIAPGEAFQIPPGHDAWIEGDETFVAVDFRGGPAYARPS